MEYIYLHAIYLFRVIWILFIINLNLIQFEHKIAFLGAGKKVVP
jgi:hypothetical protein